VYNSRVRLTLAIPRATVTIAHRSDFIALDRAKASCAKAISRFLFCLSASVSDLVSIAESDERPRLSSGEGRRFDIEEFSDGIAKPPFKLVHEPLVRHRQTRSRIADQYHGTNDFATACYDMVGKVGKRSAHRRHVIDEHISGASLGQTVESRPRVQSLHRIGSGVKHLISLNDVRIGKALSRCGQRGRQDGQLEICASGDVSCPGT
jgi:hypothetical protein